MKELNVEVEKIINDLSVVIQERALTLTQVAAHVGTSEMSVSRWLRRKSKPQPFFLRILPSVIKDLKRLYRPVVTPGVRRQAAMGLGDRFDVLTKLHVEAVALPRVDRLRIETVLAAMTENMAKALLDEKLGWSDVLKIIDSFEACLKMLKKSSAKK